jgi:hypothetical protein
MNEVMRLLDRSIRPFGYDVRKRYGLNLLKFKGIAPTPTLERVRDNLNSLAPEPGPGPDLDSIEVVLRVCLTKERLSKASRRLDGLPMDAVVERCLISLVRSLNFALGGEAAPRLTLTILDDRSDAPLLEKVTARASELLCDWKVVETRVRGQGGSLHEQFEMARGRDALFYFVEDDYLHVTSAIFEMWRFYKQIHQASGGHLVIHPQEHESLYGRSHGPAYLVLSPYRHWRSASDATHCLFMHSDVVKTYWPYFEGARFVGGAKRALGSERRTTNRLFDHLPCFSPLPALAGHLQAENCLPPFFDWRTLWDQNDPAASGHP